ncbi:MAG: hypothetical protein ABI425_04825 [Patescibacteria group bacterium]
MKNKKFWSSGQSLVEVTVASVAMIFGLVSVISGLLLAVRNSSVSNNQSLATQNTQEVIEVFRKFQRQLGWETFYSTIQADGNSVTYCLTDLPTDNASFQNMSIGACTVSANSTAFVRQASVVVVSLTEVQVTATVTWRDGTTTRTASAKNIFRSYK